MFDGGRVAFDSAYLADAFAVLQSEDKFIDGGAGVDTVSFAGGRSEYEIAYSASSPMMEWLVSSASGRHTLHSVEKLIFADGTYSLTADGKLLPDDFQVATLSDVFAASTSTAGALSAAYGILLGGIPNQAGLKALIGAALSTNFGAWPGPVFNDENIFINLVNNLVQGNPAAKTTFDSLATGSTLAEKIGSLYIEIIPGEARTVDGLAFLTRPEGIAFYQQVAAERGVAGDDGAAIIALASLLRIAVSQHIGIGNAVNDLVKAVAAGSHAIPATGTTFTDIEVADGTQFDSDEGAAARAAQSENVSYVSEQPMLEDHIVVTVGTALSSADWVT
jgi:hypothetical protein